MSLGRKVLHQPAQHVHRDRHQRHPRRGNAADLAQRLEVALLDEADRGAHRFRRHPVFVQHPQRIVAPLHVDPRDGPPAAADQEQPVALRPEGLGQVLDHLLDMGLAPAPPAADAGQLERAEIRRDPLADPSVRDLGQFHRRAADVADQPVGAGPAEQHALRRQPRLFLAVDHPDPEAGLAQHLVAELRPVLGVAHRGGGHRGQRRQAHAVGQVLEPAQRRQRAHPALRVQPPGLAPSPRRART